MKTADKNRQMWIFLIDEDYHYKQGVPVGICNSSAGYAKPPVGENHS